MKKLYLLLIAVLAATVVHAQPYKSPGDTACMNVINFEEPTPYIQIDPQAQNLWQIGAPHKSFFSQAYSVPNAIVTDTLNFYPDNNLSSFTLTVGTFNLGWYPWQMFIDFRHKFDTDTLRDGGYITISWDRGLTWANILDDTSSVWPFEVTPRNSWWPYYGNNNLYTAGDSLFNGEHGYSGKSAGWVHSCMAWYNIPVDHPESYQGDTVLLRFNFVSDGNHHDREGWMIDHIRLFNIDLGSGIGEFMAGKMKAWIMPNPMNSASTVTFDRSYDGVRYSVTDLSGKMLIRETPGNCDEFNIRRNNLSPGCYLLRICLGNGYTEVHRLMVADR